MRRIGGVIMKSLIVVVTVLLLGMSVVMTLLAASPEY
jgi:hypothetical protein